MAKFFNTNPILPAPGVSRNSATDMEASRAVTERQNDDVSGNRAPRGEASENSGREGALLRCKSLFQIGTFNVNTMREESKAAELEHMKSRAGVEILGIQEHRIVLADPLNLEMKKIGTGCLITSSGWRNSMQAAQGGVGLLTGCRYVNS